MAHKAPGKSHRQGITIFELNDMFPDEASAVKWFEEMRWPTEEDRHCPHCGGRRIHVTKNAKPMPYRCKDCRGYFSVRTGTTMESSRLPLRKWAFAVYFYVTNLKGVSSMRLHRELGVTQKTAWFMLHRLREAWSESGLEKFAGPVEADETFVGGKRKNMSNKRRRQLTGRGAVGKAIVVGSKDRETNRIATRHVPSPDAENVAGFVAEKTVPGAKVYTDESKAYLPLKADFDHHSVNHSAKEYVRDDVHTNGMESHWALLKRAIMGTYHWMSEKHLQRYIDEFAGRHNIREFDTLEQMQTVFADMVGKRLTYQNLTENEVQPSG